MGTPPARRVPALGPRVWLNGARASCRDIGGVLARVGFCPRVVSHSTLVGETLDDDRPDLVILVAPDRNLSTLRMVRKHSDVPVMLIADAGAGVDTALALELEVDDIVVDASDPLDVAIRAGNIVCDSYVRIPPRQRLGRLVVERSTREACIDGTKLELTRMEFELLAFLAARPGQIVQREELLREVWQSDADSDSATVTEHIHRLRQKLEYDPRRPRRLLTVRGRGYLLRS